MAFDEGLAERLKGLLMQRNNVTEKNLFGGIPGAASWRAVEISIAAIVPLIPCALSFELQSHTYIQTGFQNAAIDPDTPRRLASASA